jgi:hypothetical protein
MFYYVKSEIRREMQVALIPCPLSQWERGEIDGIKNGGE